MRIVTHNGVFHADDVFAVATCCLFEEVHPNRANIVRTRDPELVRGGVDTVVVDVGGTFDRGRRLFDHHQQGRAGSRENGILYSSFGLVWGHYGVRLVDYPEQWEIVDCTLVQPIDATDNGQELYTGGTAAFEGVRGYSLSKAISSFNPTVRELEATPRDSREALFLARFRDACEFAYRLLDREIESAYVALAAQSEVRVAIEASRGGPVVLLEKFAPWAEQVRDESKALYCVFPAEDGTWRVQGVNATPGTFDLRRPLPEAWAGLRDEAFAKVTGVEGAVFCHPGRFTCGAATREGALKLAELALG